MPALTHQVPQKLRNSNRIGRYEVVAKAGEGTSGIVYRAFDPALDREVAIKLARLESLDDDAVRHVAAEFRHEAKIAGKFAHENIVTIYDVVNKGRVIYLVMEFVPGRSLDDYMKATGRLDLAEALMITFRSCVGLAYIHYHGVIHRDIKPGNIMYHPAHRTVKLMDFSVAHSIEQPPSRDTGTIAYMAPEHFDPARRISQLTDIFALGSTLYRLLSGQYPFSREHTAFQILHQEPAPIRALRPDIPAPVATLIERAMAKSDAERFQSAAQFAREVEQVCRAVLPDAGVTDTTARYLAG